MPVHLGVLLGRVDVGKGREELYRNQLPELLRSAVLHGKRKLQSGGAVELPDR